MRWRGWTTRTSKSWSSTTTPRTSRLAARWRRTAPRLGAALPLLPCRAARRLQGGRAELRASATRRADAEVVAVIDSDYIVVPSWLRDLVPAFANRANRPSCRRRRTTATRGENAFKAMCYAEYRGFFHIGMVTRNERNAIIQHGTMTLVRRSLLERPAAGPSGASPRTRSSACACSRPASRRPTSRELRPGRDAGHLHRLQEAALPLGLWRDADPAPALRTCCCAATASTDPGPALSLPGGLAALARRRLQPAVQVRGARLCPRHGAGASEARGSRRL